MESSEESKGHSNVRMWILLGIFLVLAGLFVYAHFHQVNRHMERKLADGEQMDY